MANWATGAKNARNGDMPPELHRGGALQGCSQRVKDVQNLRVPMSSPPTKMGVEISGDFGFGLCVICGRPDMDD